MGAVLSREDYVYTLPSPMVSFDDQSVETGVSTRESHLLPKDGHITSVIDGVTNVFENFTHGMKIAGEEGECLGRRLHKDDKEFNWLSYGEVNRRALRVGSGLVGLKWRGEERMVGIYANNRVEWVLTYLGAASQGMTIVTLYDTLGPSAVQFCTNQAELQIIVCDTVEKAKRLLENISLTPSLTTIVVMEADIEGVADESGNVDVVSFDDLEKRGENNIVPVNMPKTDDVFIVCYTSGTTGDPKGVMLSHKAMLSCAHAVAFSMDASHVNPMSPGKRHISFLPLAHIFEQAIHIIVLMKGASMAFTAMPTLMDDLKIVRPSIFPVVPRLLGRMYDKVQSGVSGANAVSRWLFEQGFAAKLALLHKGIITRDTWWDKIIFTKMQESLGGNVEFMVTGAAPISGEVLDFCRVVFGCAIVEGYGQTECMAACTLSNIGDPNLGHVGPPLPNNTVRLMDVEEMKYWAKDNKGEVCIRGPALMKGYYKQPEKTAEAIDGEGWLHTGDIGEWLPNGTLKIIDRKKHIFKLAQGEYIAPERCENVYIRMPLIAQIYVDGDSMQRCLIAIVVPDFKEARASLKQSNLSNEEVCASKELRKAILEEIFKFGRANGLNSIEIVRNIELEAEEFSVANELLTPTMKSKRPQLRLKYKETMARLYAEM